MKSRVEASNGGGGGWMCGAGFLCPYTNLITEISCTYTVGRVSTRTVIRLCKVRLY
jgi:hypothetical protein